MPMSPCPSVEQLQQMLNNQLPDAERPPLEAHVAVCAACQQTLEQLTGSGPAPEQPRVALQPASPEEPPADFLSRLEQLATPPRWLVRRLAGQADPARDPADRAKEAVVAHRPNANDAGQWPTIPGYQILGQLGRGGMGVVYKARQRRLNCLVALKMVVAGDYASPQALVRFLLEGERIARVQHPNLVRILEVGTHQGWPFFALEYVDGSTLADYLQGIPFAPGAAATLVETLGRATHAAHVQGIMHSNLKPANILLQEAETTQDRHNDSQSAEEDPRSSSAPPVGVFRGSLIPKITDFGLAKPVSVDTGRTEIRVVAGTPYLAPEQAQGAKQVGPAADIYALGTILYELLAGRPPFRAATPMGTVLQLLHHKPPSLRRAPHNLPRDLVTICGRCLEKEPGKRYPTAEALADDLRRFLTGEPIWARRVGLAERIWKWAKRRPVIASLLAVIVVVFLSGLGGVIWQWRTAE